jgi:peptidoglycan/xylan/chitin deacetylase (PgdA/CDA1 family)
MRGRGAMTRMLAVAGTSTALMAGSIVGMVTPASAAPKPPVRTASVTVDDATTAGANRFAFSGSWRTCPGCERTALGGSFRYTSQVGAAVTFRFTGRQATITGFAQPKGGSVAVYVDGRKVSTVSLARGKKRAVAVLYRTKVLKDGAHTVVLKTVKGRKAGIVAVDKAVVVHVATAAPGKPVSAISFTFDDGKADAFTTARSVLAANGVKGTFYIQANGIGQPGFMTAEQLRQLAAEGHELGNHTVSHGRLSGLSAAAVEAEFTQANTAIQNASGVTPKTCAYPFGDSDATVRAVAAKLFTGCRSTTGGSNPVANPAKYQLKVVNVTQATTPATIRSWLTEAKRPGRWVIFVYHRVGAAVDPEDVSPAAFTQQVGLIKGSGVPVRTVADVLH